MNQPIVLKNQQMMPTQVIAQNKILIRMMRILKRLFLIRHKHLCLIQDQNRLLDKLMVRKPLVKLLRMINKLIKMEVVLRLRLLINKHLIKILLQKKESKL